MPEVSIQHLTTSISGVEPNIGEALHGELIINTAEGRIWVGDENRIPIELGGAVKSSPIGDPNSCNYVEVLINSTEDLPIRTFDPTGVIPGYYRSCRYMVTIATDEFPITFDNTVDWGESPITYKNLSPLNPLATNPIDAHKADGRKFMFELSTFGPASELNGQLLWIS